MQDLDAAVTHGANMIEPWTARGQLETKLGLLKNAEDDFDHALKIDPNNAESANRKKRLFYPNRPAQ